MDFRANQTRIGRARFISPQRRPARNAHRAGPAGFPPPIAYTGIGIQI